MSDAIWPYHKGGKEARYHHLCGRLAAHGIDVHVFTMHWWDGPSEQVVDGVRHTAVCRRRRLYVGERRSIGQALAFSLGCLRLLRHRFDVIDADHMPYLQLFPLRVVATLKRVPLVVTWHEVWGREYWRRYLGRPGSLGALLEGLAMRLPDRIVAVNEVTRDRLAAGGVPPDRLAVLPNGVDVPAIGRAAPSAESFDLIYVGRLIKHKRVADLLDAVAGLAARGSNFTCAVVGVGPERERLADRAHALGIGDQVTFLGSVDDHDEVYGLIKSAGCFVLPSVREGFGIVVVEAFACGIPVITTDHPDNQARLLVADGVTGWVTEPSVDALAEAILGSRGHRLDPAAVIPMLERCDWDHIASALTQLYAPERRAA